MQHDAITKCHIGLDSAHETRKYDSKMFQNNIFTGNSAVEIKPSKTFGEMQPKLYYLVKLPQNSKYVFHQLKQPKIDPLMVKRGRS